MTLFSSTDRHLRDRKQNKWRERRALYHWAPDFKFAMTFCWDINATSTWDEECQWWPSRYGVRDLVKDDARPRVRSPGPPSCTNNTVLPTYTVEVHSNGSPHTMWKPTVCGRVSNTLNTNSIPQHFYSQLRTRGITSRTF